MYQLDFNAKIKQKSIHVGERIRKDEGRCLGLRRVRNYATSFHNFSQNYFTSFSSSQSGEADLRTGVVPGSEKPEPTSPKGGRRSALSEK